MRGRQLIMTMAILLAALFVINRIEDPVPVGGEEQLQDVQGLLERANQQERHMVVPRFHDNKAARETSNMYHSRKYQARLQKEIKWLKARVFPDVMTQAKNASTPKSTENAFLLPDERIYVFISSSIPVSTLRNYAADLDKLKDPHISMVMRGFVDGMHYIKPTIEFIEKILIKDPTCVSAYDPEPADVSSRQGERGSHTPKCDVYQATVNVDPLLYSRYGIQRVPAILYVRGVHSIDSGQSEGITDNTSVSDAYIVTGDVSLEYALESIRKASKANQIQRILEELRRGFY